MVTLLTLALRRRRDVVLARQRARQIASLLRFDIHEQACIAAGAFAVAAQALAQLGPCRLVLRLEEHTLHIFAQQACPAGLPTRRGDASQPFARLAKPLPPQARELTREDLAWISEQLTRRIPPSIFEEIQHQNQEMLALLHALHTAQAQLRAGASTHVSPSAA
jgi:hypothetical protein